MADTAALPRSTAKPQQEVNVPHVYVATNAVMRHMAGVGIAKTERNEQQRFNFRGIDNVMNALSSVLAENDLLIFPRVLKREVDERQAKSGGVLYDVVLEVEYDFVSARDGSAKVVGPFPGEAMDSGDKATNKALSAAYKYMATETFCIPTEGDNDADAQTPPETKPRSAHSLRKENVWPPLIAALKKVVTVKDFKAWEEDHAEIVAQFPASWSAELQDEIAAHKEWLAAERARAREAAEHV